MSSSSKGSNDSSHPSRSSTTSILEGVGTSLISMTIPVSSHLKDEVVMTDPKVPKCKECVIIKMAGEFGVMPLCDARAPEPTEMVADAQEGEMTFFRDTLKGKLRWPLIPFSSTFWPPLICAWANWPLMGGGS